MKGSSSGGRCELTSTSNIHHTSGESSESQRTRGGGRGLLSANAAM